MHRLPSELELSDDQVRELLAYHRIHGKSQLVCSECSEESRNREKTCFVCGRSYTEKAGPVGERTDGKKEKHGGMDANFREIMGSKFGRKEQAKMTPEEEAAFIAEQMAKAKAAGVGIIE